NACSSRRSIQGPRNGMPLRPGRALKSSTDVYGQYRTFWPFTVISKAMLPTDGRMETVVCVPVSRSCTNSPIRFDEYGSTSGAAATASQKTTCMTIADRPSDAPCEGVKGSLYWPGVQHPAAVDRQPPLEQGLLGRAFGRTLRVPDRLQGEVVVFHGRVVLDLQQREPRAAAPPRFSHLELPRGPNTLDILDIGIRESAYNIVLDETVDPRRRVVVLADPHNRARVLGPLGLFWRRLNLPAVDSRDRFDAEHRKVELVDVALFEILEAEIGAEETGRPVLHGDSAVALDCRGPHPLIGSSIRMIENEQRH